MEVILVSKIPTIIIVLLFMEILTVSKTASTGTCSEGFYKDSSENGNKSCRVCSKCPSGSGVISNCTDKSDTVCRSCDPGTFSGGGFKCQNCSHCPPGTFVADYCSLKSDTRCEPCPKGMYSSDWSMRYCKRCTRCSRLMTALKNCSKTENYQCGDCIQGYYKHPNLPMCIKCAYCYPDNPGATVVIPECLTKSDDPNMRCMPIGGVPQPVGFAGSDSLVLTSAFTTSPTSILVMSSTLTYSHVLIPRRVSIPIIIVCVSLTVLVIIPVVIYKCQKRNRKLKSYFQLCIASTFRITNSKCPRDKKRDSYSSNEIVLCASSDASGNINLNDTEPSGPDCETRGQTTADHSHRKELTLLSNPDGSCNVNVEKTLVSDHPNDTEKATVSNFNVVIGHPVVQTECGICKGVTQRGSNAQDERDSNALVSNTSVCAENEAFEDDSDGFRTILPKDSSTHKQVRYGQFLIPSKSPSEVKTRLTISVISNSKPVTRTGEETRAFLKPNSLISSTEQVQLKPLPLTALISGVNDCGSGSDSEDSSRLLSAMSSDCDSDTVVMNTLLDSGRDPANNPDHHSEMPGVQMKKRRKKSRRRSGQGTYDLCETSPRL